MERRILLNCLLLSLRNFFYLVQYGRLKVLGSAYMWKFIVLLLEILEYAWQFSQKINPSSLVHKFCDQAIHNPIGPTKQNALCRGRSVTDKLVKSVDLWCGRWVGVSMRMMSWACLRQWEAARIFWTPQTVKIVLNCKRKQSDSDACVWTYWNKISVSRIIYFLF